MRPPYHQTMVPDCGYCKDIGDPCARLLECNLPPEGWTCSRPRGHEGPCAARPADRVGVGFWPGLKEGEPDHWYIFWIDREHPTSSAPKEPTEAEVRAAVAAINAMPMEQAR